MVNIENHLACSDKFLNEIYVFYFIFIVQLHKSCYQFNFSRNHQIFLDLFFALFYFLHFQFCVCTKLFSYMTVWQTESISVQYIPKYHADLYYECFLRRNFILRQTKKFFRICYLSDFSVAILKTFTRLCLQTVLQASSLFT